MDIKKVKVFVDEKEIAEFGPNDFVKVELHTCLKAPTDFLAWRNMKTGDICPYCGYIYL